MNNNPNENIDRTDESGDKSEVDDSDEGQNFEYLINL